MSKAERDDGTGCALGVLRSLCRRVHWPLLSMRDSLAYERQLGFGMVRVAVAVTAVAVAAASPISDQRSAGAESGQERSGAWSAEPSSAGAQTAAGESTKDKTPTERTSVAPAGTKGPMSGRQLYERMLHASAWIVAQHASNRQVVGTAWLVDRPGRLLVTNHHVLTPWVQGIPSRKPVKVYFPQSRDGNLITDPREELSKTKSYEGRIVDLDPVRDLAILQVDGLPPDTEALALSAESCRPGEAVHSLGNAAGEALWIYASGTVRQVYPREVDEGGLRIMRYQCVQTQAPVNRGDSGGPVVNDEGQLVAVNQSIAVPRALGVGTLTTYAVDVHEVRAFLDEVRPMLGPSTADDFFRRGLRHLSRGRAKSAISDFDEALRRMPPERDPGAILIGRARAKSRANLNCEAVADLTRALRTSPDDPEILVCRGRALLKTDDAPSAQDDFDRVLTLAAHGSVKDDLLAQAHLGRATISGDARDDASYARHTNQASQSNPRDFEAHVRRAALLDARGELKDALEESNKALKVAQEELDPIKRLELLGQIHTAFRNRAHVYARMKRHEDALRDYGAAVHWRMRVPPYKATAPFLVAVAKEMLKLGYAQQGKSLMAIAEKLPTYMGADRPTFRERLLYVENKSPHRLVVFFKYHTLGENKRWEWHPGGDMASSEWASSTFEPGAASMVAVQGEPISADRIRYVVKTEKNETVNDNYWSKDLVLATPQGYQGETLEKYTLQLP